MLPRLKFHNPGIPMTVSRQTSPAPAILNIYVNKEVEATDENARLPTIDGAQGGKLQFAEVKEGEQTQEIKTTTAPFRLVSSAILKDATPKFEIGKLAPFPNPNERIVQINMLERSERDIWEEFAKITKAIHVVPTPGELETLQELDEKKSQSQIDSDRGIKLREQLKREKDMLKMAAGAFDQAIADETR
jgi:large subunit ribosomal protein MRP49